ncbi:NAD(P)-dependent oxidoreductase [Amycolatopsis acidiphila]|uniref:NAD(P)-dependent oxidoreductase n=2 Tax=Amycolatopsis acidiphila TaxID=715473 RepID=A0A558ALI7_9PSEU|nr:NAD(P)-dependent oxidoreductase [Amycolatopsis acidiphila]
MGTPMATRLLEAGHDVTVWNRTAARTGPLVDSGARAADSPAEAVAGADTVFTMLANPAALDQVLSGELVATLRPGQVLVDMSTVGPAEIRSLARRLPGEVTLVDSPVRGSVPEATEGRLIIYTGATAAAYEKVRPLLTVLGTPHHVGGPGAGAATKVVVNLTLGVAMTALGEALALGDTLELDRSTLLDILAESPLGATVRAKRANLESGTYPPSFKLSLALKDLHLVTATAAQQLPIAAATLGWLERATHESATDPDFSAVVETIRAARLR